MNDNLTIALMAFLCIMAVITIIFASSMYKNRRNDPLPVQEPPDREGVDQQSDLLSLRRTTEAAVPAADEPEEEFVWGAEETPSTES